MDRIIRMTNVDNIHFIGIGGIGMSGLAEILLSRGKRVSGSDLKDNPLTERLRARGAVVLNGHSPKNVSGDTQLIVRSSCIRSDNPEMLEASKRGIPVIRRGELLMRLMDLSDVAIAVTGTHG
ncbi:MAG: UDP-N-acetylmuramate--L-alanine ligase, partial [Candidatus Omnitrophica bacterium]|nr:UDP-N-acetylmuramate--L-alanine ligase [Candidatus Omnitrophota bacterium]